MGAIGKAFWHCVTSTATVAPISRDGLAIPEAPGSVEHTPIDYLDFASPVSGLGSKIGFDATTKWSGETTRTWGRPIQMTMEVKQRVDDRWASLDLD